MALLALVMVVLTVIAIRYGRRDRRQDQRAEDVRDYKEIVGEIAREQHRLRGQAVSPVDLKPLRDLQLKAELAPDRLPRPLQLCAQGLESRLGKYLAVAGPAFTGCSAEERDARLRRFTYEDQRLKEAIETVYEGLDAY